ncbi:MAG: hypothetical protein QFC55_03920 [Chloroflexota bacterium]|nr:hypothetical protein [Chloroflexota bacterium]
MEAQLDRHHQAPVSGRLAVIGLAFVCLTGGVLACDSPAKTPRPSSSLIVLQFTPQPSRSSGPPATPGRSPATWPLGWDASFCAMFSQAVDAQQLLVDVQLDIDDGKNHDARLLAGELIQSAGAATDAITTLPDWPDGQPVVVGIAGLMDLASRAGDEYHSWFADGKRAALGRAQALRSENGGQVAEVNGDLAALADQGLNCQGTSLVLEAAG